MKILIFIILFCVNIASGGVSIEDWEVTPSLDTHCKVYYSDTAKTSKWVGYPDPNYSFDGDVLSWERTVKDENNKDITVKTYKEPFEIIADLKAESKVYGIDNKGGIERAVAAKFRSSLKGFIWIDKVAGGGEVLLPFTAPHIFKATGDRLKPKLTEIFTYELDKEEIDGKLFETGKTRVFVDSFSGLGGSGDPPAELIAHYKMNEDTASDNDDLVTNGNFAAWAGDNPTGWTVEWEAGNDPEVSEAATGESHADTPTLGGGMCNIYSTTPGEWISIYQVITTVVGRKYRVSINVNKVTAGSIDVASSNSQWTAHNYGSTGIKTFTFVATVSSFTLYISRNFVIPPDVTFDDVSVKLLAVEDSSGNDHDGLLQEDTDAAHVAGKVSGAFDFDGAADYIEIADHADFTPALTPFSVSAWIYMHDASNFTVASKGIEGADGEWRLYTDAADKLIFRQYDESINKYRGQKSDDALTAYENTWVHIVSTADGSALSSGIKLYVNSALIDDTVDEDAGFVAIENLTGDVHLGRYNALYANGLIDNVTIYSTELDQADVDYLWSGGGGREDWKRYLFGLHL